MAVRPTIITDEDTLAAVLRGRRIALGISQQALDDRIGWADGYCAKVEAPGRAGHDGKSRGYGRRVAWGMAKTLSWWLESLGLVLVVMDKAQAEAMIATSNDDDIAQSVHTPYAGRGRRRDIVQRRVLRLTYSFPGGKAA